MFEQLPTPEPDMESGPAERAAPSAGYGACLRCQSEGCPNPCFGFVGSGTICQRNWCAHNFADHA